MARLRNAPHHGTMAKNEVAE
jgi:hypothetical protein